MAINERLIDTEVAAAGNGGGLTEAEQGLILHLDANDVDSYDGDGTEWVDISTFEKTIPISDNADSLELYLNASDSTSYGGSGTTWTDISGNSNDGTISGAVFDTDNGGYFDFDGVNDYALIPSTASTPFQASLRDFTLSIWINRDTAGYAPLITKYGTFSSTRSWYFGINPSGQLYISWWNGSSLVAKTATSAILNTTGVWYHVALSVNASTMDFYVNGELKNSLSGSVTHTSGGNEPIVIGSQSGGNYNFFNGKVGQVRIYSSALSASDIGQNYRHGRDIVYTNLIPDTDLELHLDASDLTTSSTSWVDNIDSNNSGTLGNATYEKELGDSVYIPATGFSSGNVINFSNNPVHNQTTYTIESWVKFGDYSVVGTATYITLSNHSSQAHISGRVALAGYPDGVYRDYIDQVNYPSNGGVTDGYWHHCVSVRQGTSLKQYLDGELVGTHTVSSNAPSSDEMTLGAYKISSSTYNGYFGGDIGQVRIYSAGLTEDQIRQNYNFTKPSYPNGFDGTISGATWNAGGYFNFDGSNDYIDLTASSPFGTSTTQSDTLKSFTGWVKLDAGTSAMIYTASSTASSNDYFTFQIRNTSPYIFIQARDGSSTNQFLDTTSYIPDTNWHHYVFQVTDTTREIYIDGVKKTLSKDNRGTATDTSWISYPTYASSVKHEIQRGRVVSPYYGSGKISKVKYYDKTLTQAEITALYNEGN